MKLFRSVLFLTTVSIATFTSVSCGGGLSATCQKALNCCTAAQSAEGQTGDELKIACSATGFSLTANCKNVNTMNSAGGSLAEAGCSTLVSTITGGLTNCKKTIPSACN